MFQTASNEEIGKFLSNTISNKYKSMRKFCAKYIELEGLEPTSEEIAKMQNRMSQIKLGKKGVQITDLGYFTELLEVTCEEILSAGKYAVIDNNRYTNYKFAFSKDEKYWEKYIHRDDKIILNTDEYGMTVIDYALKFKNYKLQKYLTENKYIWFVDHRQADCGLNFGAGTSIERKFLHEIDVLGTNLKYNDRLRTEMIILAIDNNDFEMLEALHARETPALHFACRYTPLPEKYEEYYNEDIITGIVKANDKILNYFSDPFTVKTDDREAVFIFPFLGRLIDTMVKQKHKKTEAVLNQAIRHNKQTLERLGAMVTLDYQSYKNTCDYDKTSAFQIATRHFQMKDSGILSFTSFNCSSTHTKLVTNVLSVKERSKNIAINALIDELNQIYENIRTLNKNKLIIGKTD